jgi:hypothetical protein
VFCEREIGDWVQKAAGESVDPGDGDLHPLMGAVFYPGLYPATSALSPAPSTSDLEIISSGNTVLGARAGADFVALATKVHAALEAIKATLTGGITTISGGAGSFTVPLVIDTAVAASKVKAK